MSWKFNEVRPVLISDGLHPTESTHCSYGKVSTSPQIPITEDELERNVAAYYIYGTNEDEALLLELTLGKSNQEFLAKAEANFKQLVSKLFLAVTQQKMPAEWDLTADTVTNCAGFVIKCVENQKSCPSTVNVLIAHRDELQKGLDIRQQFLYSTTA
jgi:hypothetical protein